MILDTFFIDRERVHDRIRTLEQEADVFSRTGFPVLASGRRKTASLLRWLWVEEA